MQKRAEGAIRELSVIIVTWNSGNVIRQCLDCLNKEISGIAAEVIVVDNQSTDGTADLIESNFPMVKLIRSPENLGFAAGNNLGLSHASGRYALLLNPDAFLDRGGSLQALLSYMDKYPEIGVLGGHQHAPDGRSLKSYNFVTPETFLLPNYLLKLIRRVPRIGLTGSSLHRFDLSYVYGAFFLIPRYIFLETGGFDEKFFAYFEEADLCLRIRRLGKEVVYFGDFHFTHLGGDSFGQLSDRGLLIYYESMYYFVEKHYGRLLKHGLRIRLILRYGAKFVFYRLKNLNRPESTRLKKYRALLRAQLH